MNEALAKFAKDQPTFLVGSGKPLSAPDVYKHGLSKIRLEGAHSLRRFRATRLDLVRLSRPTFVYCESGMEKTAPEDSGRSEP